MTDYPESDRPRFFVPRLDSPTDCINCGLPDATHQGRYNRCKIAGPAGPVAAAESGALWAKQLLADRAQRLGQSNSSECPTCGRVMSLREETDQGACNDCHGVAWSPADGAD